jgi:hypothetical protein
MPHKPARRDLLKTTATVTVTSALALSRGTVAPAKEPADAAAETLPQVDAVLRAKAFLAVDASTKGRK